MHKNILRISELLSFKFKGLSRTKPAHVPSIGLNLSDTASKLTKGGVGRFAEGHPKWHKHP